MRKILAFTALAAPFALLACGSDVDEADSADNSGETEMMSEAPADEGPINAVTVADNDVSGEYTMTGEDGTQSTLSLNSSDNSYTYNRGDGESFSGKYSLYDDYRLLIEDFDGQPAYFSYDLDNLYRLSSETSLPQDRITVTGEYQRSNLATGQTGGPNATTNTINDKRE